MAWGRRTVLFSVFLLGLVLGASGQSSLNEVHVVPLANDPKASPVKQDHSLWANAGETIRKQVDLVLVPVTITDERDHLITGLAPANFQLFDGKQKQQIKHFSNEDVPVSLGIVLDLSGSMSSKIEWAREAVMEFCKTANPADEFFLLSFADRPELLADFTSKVGDIQARLPFAVPKGRTALLDAVYSGIHQMQGARYAKRALLIISDGGDNRSRYTEGEIKALVKEADVMLYAIAIVDPAAQSPEEIHGPELLTEIAELTGGRAFGILQPNLLPAIANRVGIELRNQYVLGYHPENTPRNGQWHKIQVKIRLPKSIWPVWVHARSGYYASPQ